MSRRDFIVNTLVRLGFRTSLKGFAQFCDCVELYMDGCGATIDSIYERVAEGFNCSKGSIEKNLCRLFTGSDACAAIGNLFGTTFTDRGNKEIVAIFSNYVALQRNAYMA